MRIQDLIDAASPGSTVNVPPGIYNEQIVVEKQLTIQGPIEGGPAVIDASGLDAEPTIRIQSDDVTIKKLTILNGPTHGIRAGGTNAEGLTGIVISNNHIKGHGNAGIITGHTASIDIKHNVIENNGQGSGFNRGGIILYPHGKTNIVGNTIKNNVIEGIFARASTTGLLIKGNVIENHSNSGITLAWDQINTTVINNQIQSCGTGNSDEQGGIVIIQSMAETIRGNMIRNCAYSGIFWGWVPTIEIPPTQILIEDNKIIGSSGDAIYLFSQGPGGFISPDIFPLEPKVTQNILQGNGRAGVYVSNLYYYSPGNANPTINCNQITDNAWGVYNATAQTINAVDNWWGNNSGPFHPETNPTGTGDPVGDRVNFIPWKTKPTTIQIIHCSITNIDLKHYKIAPAVNEKSEIALTINIMGNVELVLNGNQTNLPFETYFIKTVAMKLPETPKIVPTILSTSTCGAVQINNAIQIKIDICILVSAQARQNILIPIFAQRGLPRSHNLDNCYFRKSNLPAAKIYDTIQHVKPQNINACINVERVFDSCKFRKTLIYEVCLVTIKN